MIHTLILAVLLYAIVRAALRGRQPDPMAGRLVPRGVMTPARPLPAIEAAPTKYAHISNLMWYAPPESINLETGEWK